MTDTHYPITTELKTGNTHTGISLLLIYTGGTIGMDYDLSGKHLVPLDFERIREKVPELQQFGYALTLMTPFPPLDSADLQPEHWGALARLIYENYDSFDGFLILHGTDTMAYTASALSFLLENLAKPVVLTGSQLPMSAHRTDARENLTGALEVAAAQISGRPAVPEVCIFFDSVLLRGNRSRKAQSVHFSAFHSPNYPLLGEAGIFMDYNRAYILPLPARGIRLHEGCCPQVQVLKIYPGMPESYATSILEDPEVKGVILEAFGAGNIPSQPWLWRSLEKAAARDVVLFNISQCMGGTVLQGHYATSGTLVELGVVSGRDITSEAALTKMMTLLEVEPTPDRVRQQLARPLCGEMRDDADYQRFTREVVRRNVPASLFESEGRLVKPEKSGSKKS